MDEIKTMLDEEIKSEIESLKEFDYGSEEQTTAVENLTKLYKLRIEEAKDAQEMAHEKKNQWIRVVMDTAGLVLPLAFYARWMKKGFQFEKEGTFTSTTFRGLFNRFRPTK